jgi:hypothetical protein
MVVTKKFILEKSFNGAPRDDNFKLIEEQLDELKNGGIYDSFFNNTLIIKT